MMKSFKTVIAAGLLCLVLALSTSGLAYAAVGTLLTAQEFLDTYCGKTIPDGLGVQIMSDTSGTASGDCIITIKGSVQAGTNVSLRVEGEFKLDGRDGQDGWFPGTQIQIGSNASITAGAVHWLVSDGIQLEESFSMHASGDITLDTDADVQIKKVEDAQLALLPNIAAGGSVTVQTDGNLQIGDGNRIDAGEDISLIGKGEFSDIQIGQAAPLAYPSMRAGRNLKIITRIDGDVQLFENNTLYAAEQLTLEANGEGDLQLLAADPALPIPRVQARNIFMKGGGDINIQSDRDTASLDANRGGPGCSITNPDILATSGTAYGGILRMEGYGEVELEPGIWACGKTIRLETKGVEVQVQPRAYVTLEAAEDILLYAFEENAGVKVGEYAVLRAGNDVFMSSGVKEQGEGDTEVKENSIVSAGRNIHILSAQNGSTMVKEDVSVAAGNSITIESELSGQTVVKHNNLSAYAVNIGTGIDGQCDIHIGAVIDATVKDLCYERAGAGGNSYSTGSGGTLGAW